MGKEFCYLVDGPGMEPDFPHGSFAHFEWRSTRRLNMGGKYYLEFTDGDRYFCRVLASPKRGKLVLGKINPDRKRFPDRVISRRYIERAALCTGITIPMAVLEKGIARRPDGFDKRQRGKAVQHG